MDNRQLRWSLKIFFKEANGASEWSEKMAEENNQAMAAASETQASSGISLEFGTETEAQSEAAAPIAAAAVQQVGLTLGETDQKDPEAATKDDADHLMKELEGALSKEEIAQVEEFSKKIDINNTNAIIQYGAGPQKKMADFSEKTLENVRSKDLGEVGGLLSGLVTEIKGFDIEDEKGGGLFGFFKKKANSLTEIKARYDKVEVNVDKIVKSLDNHQITLLKDVAMLDQMYALNQTYYKELSMYILAGKKKIQHMKTVDLPELQKKAQESGSAEDAQKANDMSAMITRFEKKVNDLMLTRMIAIQTAPQIRMIQSNDQVMAEKIQSTIVNTIPLWKQQMVLTLGVEHQAQAAKAEREVTDMTNELLKKNSEKLKMATIETAKETERGIVDIETLKKTNENLISTIDEVIKIQTEGRAKRQQAEAELGKMETTLKKKLLEVKAD